MSYFAALILAGIGFWLMPKAEASLRFNMGATLMAIAALILGWSLGRNSREK